MNDSKAFIAFVLLIVCVAGANPEPRRTKEDGNLINENENETMNQ